MRRIDLFGVSICPVLPFRSIFRENMLSVHSPRGLRNEEDTERGYVGIPAFRPIELSIFFAFVW